MRPNCKLDQPRDGDPVTLHEHDEGFTIIANYQRQLDLSKGFYLELHRHQTAEQYRIKYIAVDVELD